MENIITIALTLFFLFLFGARKKKKPAAPPPPRRPIFADEEVPEPSPEPPRTFRTFSPEPNAPPTPAPQPPKSESYFTYESQNLAENRQKPTPQTNSAEKSDFDAQVIDNQEDSQVELQFSQEEFIKGVIFSEILKKPYN